MTDEAYLKNKTTQTVVIYYGQLCVVLKLEVEVRYTVCFLSTVCLCLVCQCSSAEAML